MSVEQNKETIRRLYNAINAGQMRQIDELLADDVVYRTAAGEEVHGLEGAKDFIAGYRNAFEGLELSFKDIIAEGDKVAYIYQQTGKHTGEFDGISPTNNQTDVDIMGIATFEDGKAVEFYEIYDSLRLMQQLGEVSEDVGIGSSKRAGGERPRP